MNEPLYDDEYKHRGISLLWDIANVKGFWDAKRRLNLRSFLMHYKNQWKSTEKGINSWREKRTYREYEEEGSRRMSRSKLHRNNDHVDFPEAAKKHLEDAKKLFLHERYTGAAYLCGYVYECIYKTMLQLENKYSKIHNLNQLSSEASTCAQLSGTKTAKYQKNQKPLDYDKSGNHGWSENLRYFTEDFINRQKADEWLTNAENFFNATIREMKLDGLL